VYHKPVLLSPAHRTDGFDSGEPSLDNFLVNVALCSQIERHARTFVIAGDDGLVLGYHALCAGMLDRKYSPRQIGGHGAPREIPVALLARLAVDRRHQGKKLGSVLLRHAFAAVLAASQTVAFRAIIVHALHDEAAAFYAKFGFKPVDGLERTMVISLQDVARIIEASTAGAPDR
jgi:GNAT superfamily N-acetyltransferase